ncbi:unnamed protein product [Darwinula stevensoni]|uniref:Uncharacterized protein n=1 Tax=Darwinula stevensoni TaxID=69355 RepID=A0A7R9A5A0_9CRUS|nr:unnamed protein product [Darwinula stevensoni]CAG0884936.1 unnamed protein product [Darwinula stevensoni]
MQKRGIILLFILGVSLVLGKPVDEEKKEEESKSKVEEIKEDEKPSSREGKSLLPVPPEVVVTSGTLTIKDAGSNRQSRLVRVGPDGIPIIMGVRVPDDESDKKTWRNAKVINGELFTKEDEAAAENRVKEARELPEAREGDRQPRILNQDAALGKRDGRPLQQQDSSFQNFYDPDTNGYNTQDATSYGTAYQDSQGYGNTGQSGGLLYSNQYNDGKKPVGVVAGPADPSDFVLREYNFQGAPGGPSFSVPVPVPKDQAQGYGYTESGFGYGPSQYESYYQPGRPNNYRQQGNNGNNMIQRMSNRFRNLVKRRYQQWQQFVSPVMDPLREAGQRISENLGIVEPMQQLNERLAGVVGAPTTPLLVGSAVALGALGLGAYALNNIQVEVTRKSGKSVDQVKILPDTAKSLGNETDTEGEVKPKVKRSADDASFLSNVLEGIENPHGFLNSISDYGADQWKESPCTQRVVCDLLTIVPFNVLDDVEFRLNNFFSLVESREDHGLQMARKEFMESVRRRNCGIYVCGGEGVDGSRIDPVDPNAESLQRLPR